MVTRFTEYSVFSRRFMNRPKRRSGFTSELFTGRKRGFTLIELLVVVTIIVVLQALLTPALDKAVCAATGIQTGPCPSTQTGHFGGCTEGDLKYCVPARLAPPERVRVRSTGRRSANPLALRLVPIGPC